MEAVISYATIMLLPKCYYSSMEHPSFSPKQPIEGKTDTVANGLSTLATYVFFIALGISPLFFVPLAAAPLAHTKTIFVFIALLLAITLYALSVLRSGTMRVQITTPVFAFWVVLIATSISALFSADLTDSFIGATIPAQTVVFVSLLALIMTGCHLFLRSKQVVMQLYLLLYAVAIVLGIYHIFRIIFGPNFLSFGLSVSEVFTPIGNWNDLAVFYGLIVILSLVVLEQLPLPKIARYGFAGTAVLAVILLTVVQFTLVWILIGFVALISLMFSLTRHRFNPDYKSLSILSPLLSGVIALLALVFLLGGTTFGNVISQATGVEYLEVRPTTVATIDIAQGVYSQNALLGIGPNKFVDAWRLHRDNSLNNTVFWNTDFTAGSSYIATVFTTTGAVGVIAWLAFFFSFLFIGYKMFISHQRHDPFWHFIATSSYIAALYLWIIAIVYVPGTAIMMLAALCTGVALVSYSNLCTVPVLTFDSTKNRQATAVLIAGVLLLIIGSVSASFNLVNHYSATYTFNTAFSASSFVESNQRIEAAYEIFSHESFARQRALNSIVELNQLLQLQEPDEEAQQQFEQSLVAGVTAAQEAVRRDSTNALNWAVQAAVYSTLLAADISNAAELAYESIERAQALYPTNPEFYALEAQIAFRANDEDRARQAINRSLQQKPDYVTALSLLTEIDILSGQIETAVESVQAMIRLQPTNPGLRYQLAVLQLAQEQQSAAISALEQAIGLDPDFANARYILALQYADQNRQQAALSQLERVLELNPGNQEVISLIAQIEAGEPIDASAGTSAPNLVDDLLTGTEEDPTRSDPTPDSDLLQPVNVTPSGVGQDTDSGEEPVLQAPTESSEDS